MIDKMRITQFVISLSLLLSIFGGCGDGEKKTEIRFVEAVEDFTQISTDELNFGRREDTLVVTLINNNYETARWIASTEASWITVEPADGFIEPWSEHPIRITVDRSQLSQSEGTGMVTIEIPGYGEKKQIQVKVQNSIPERERQKNSYRL